MNDLIVKSWHDLYKRIVDTLGHESSSELTAAIYSATLKLAGK